MKRFLPCLTMMISLFFLLLAVADEQQQRQLNAAEEEQLAVQHMRNIAVSQRFVDKLNSKKSIKWKAKVHPHISRLGLEEKKKLLGLTLKRQRPPVKPSLSTQDAVNERDGEEDENKSSRKITADDAILEAENFSNISTNDDANANTNGNNSLFRALPTNFDARERWSKCAAVIGHIRDQTSCGSCWALSTASSFTDRLCIVKTNAGQKVDADNVRSYKSTLDILSCAVDVRNGCLGGDPAEAWKYLQKFGAVSGGDFEAGGCLPYPFPPIAASYQYDFRAPPCPNKCLGKNFAKRHLGTEHLGM